jgi:type II secretory pathway pseudopilin PulG
MSRPHTLAPALNRGGSAPAWAWRARQACQVRPFTLVELLAAMAVLVLLMTVVFSFLVSAQKAWSLTETNTRIYENAQVAFEVLTRDLQSAMFSADTGREIPFYTGPSDATSPSNVVLAFAAEVDPSEVATSRVCEIQYLCYTQPGDPDNSFWLRRSRTCDRTTSGTNADWDFYADTTTGTTTNWVSTRDPAQKVVDGVEGLTLVCYDASGNSLAQPSYAAALPKAVQITLTLFDPKLRRAPPEVRSRSKRTFTKTVFLRGQT